MAPRYSSFSSSPNGSAIAWSPKRRVPGKRPLRRSRDKTQLSLEPSSDAIEDRFNAIDARDRLVNDRRQFAGADHVERARQRLSCPKTLKKPTDLGISVSSLSRPLCLTDSANASAWRVPALCVNPALTAMLAKLENLFERLDALGALRARTRSSACSPRCRRACCTRRGARASARRADRRRNGMPARALAVP